MKLICHESSLLTSKMRMFRLEPTCNSDTLKYAANPGEYFIFNFPDEKESIIQRCYTLISSEHGKYYDFIIENKGEKSASSIISRLLLDKKEIEVTGRSGNINFSRIQDRKNVLLLAGGIGITLPLALIRECFKAYGYIAPDKHVLLMLSCTEPAAIPFLNELFDLYTRCDWFTIRINVTRAGLLKHSEVFREGRVNMSEDSIPIIPDTTIICGSTHFAEFSVNAVKKRFPFSDISVEAFSSAKAATAEMDTKAKGCSIKLESKSLEITANKARTVLDNLLEQNIPIRHMCRSGICGSCKFKLKSGSVRSEPDFCLSEKDKAEKIYLACCSYPDGNASIEIA
ncbi:hypothetical protein BS639_24165 [Rouxiella silvae]|uniref:2Fe-2S ferredoxin-type domain-containing protein n=1 Tax=Rouxiella silvae TaxID=1646373 RepID=A0ABX3TTV1_9GAMM|nr:iron-sulfur cluster-binding domain-containing protein [Rouxiella silvae]ORJ18648.1 hypothetical protein BS639_24165 [Rouxiella silvae]